MKKLFFTMLAMTTLTMASCKKYDDSDLIDQIEDLEAQVAANEAELAAAQSALNSANSAINALSLDAGANEDNIERIRVLLDEIVALVNTNTGALQDSLVAATEHLQGLIDELQDDVNALTATEFSYDSDTGVLTIIMADGSEYVTGDLRGADGANGLSVSGDDGDDGDPGMSAFDIWAASSEASDLNEDGEINVDDFFLYINSSGDASQSGWSPAFLAQTADFEQTNSAILTIDGTDFAIGTVSRTITVSADAVGGESTVTSETRFLIGTDEYATLALAQTAVETDADTNIGSETTIIEQSRTNTETSAIVTTYSAADADGNAVGGSHTATTTEASSDNGTFAEVESHTYTKLGDPADLVTDWAPAFGTQKENFTQSRTVTVVGNDDNLASSREITVSSATTTESVVSADVPAADLDASDDGDGKNTYVKTTITYTFTGGDEYSHEEVSYSGHVNVDAASWVESDKSVASNNQVLSVTLTNADYEGYSILITDLDGGTLLSLGFKAAFTVPAGATAIDDLVNSDYDALVAAAKAAVEGN